MKKNKFFVYSFYRFINISDKKRVKKCIDKFLSDKPVRGTILLANEGINGSISASKYDLDVIISFIKKTLRIRKLEVKINNTGFLPFNRMKVRIKKEIVSLGQGNINVIKSAGKYIKPKDWDKITNNKEFMVIDTRNKFEINIGSFINSLNPKTTSFREFPKKFNDLKIDKKTKIAMFCTGGIRCEKASSFLISKGYKNIYQLDGGILNYLDYKKEKKLTKMNWKGDCFVFDNRVTVNKNLKHGKYIQCYGCRRPIKRKDTLSPYYRKGVSCHLCHDERSNEQKKRSATRQNQLDDRKSRLSKI